MIPKLLREIVAKGESLNAEFKGEEKAALSDSALVEAVICLANRSGVEPGWLLVGVEDDGRITGSRPGAVHVQWHEDRIEISNPGGFPEGVRLDKIKSFGMHK